ncbi:hypothetical protein, partial [Pseudomonas syringae]|uniref:hypothetical protein n=1 Tax=Pseudomonas syringae TaxID=317 RepID=UPI001F3C853A
TARTASVVTPAPIHPLQKNCPLHTWARVDLLGVAARQSLARRPPFPKKMEPDASRRPLKIVKIIEVHYEKLI